MTAHAQIQARFYEGVSPVNFQRNLSLNVFDHFARRRIHKWMSF